jgi:hypothetical protein
MEDRIFPLLHLDLCGLVEAKIPVGAIVEEDPRNIWCFNSKGSSQHHSLIKWISFSLPQLLSRLTISETVEWNRKEEMLLYWVALNRLEIVRVKKKQMVSCYFTIEDTVTGHVYVYQLHVTRQISTSFHCFLLESSILPCIFQRVRE